MKRYTNIMIVFVTLTLTATGAQAHCDAIDGPVVSDARLALAERNIDRALKWVHPGGEAEIRSAFDETLRVRVLGPEAQGLADRHFFETLVRVHRAGEGAPFTGLKPAGTIVEPGVAAAEAALTSGDIEPLAGRLMHAIETGLRERQKRVLEAQAHAGENVAAGRRYVAAYTDYIHYVEAVHAAAVGTHHTRPEEPRGEPVPHDH
jgi:hypothetical protein